MKNLFKLFESSFETDDETVKRFKKLVVDQPHDYFGKKSKIAHITGSALVVDETREWVLLTNHKKLHQWLQLGGHWCDFDEAPTESLFAAAMREVREEGYANRDVPIEYLNHSNPIDLDIHSVGDHHHYDVCFLVSVNKSEKVAISDESNDVSWLKISDILVSRETFNPRLVKMIEKAMLIEKGFCETKQDLK